MKKFFLLITLFIGTSAFAGEVYKCIDRWNDFNNGPMQNYYTLILNNNQVYYYLEVNNVFDGSDLAAELKPANTPSPVGVGAISEVLQGGVFKIDGDQLVSPYEAAIYGRPLNRHLLISQSIYKGERTGTLSVVSTYHDDRSKDPTRALTPKSKTMKCLRTK